MYFMSFYGAQNLQDVLEVCAQLIFFHRDVDEGVLRVCLASPVNSTIDRNDNLA